MDIKCHSTYEYSTIGRQRTGGGGGGGQPNSLDRSYFCLEYQSMHSRVTVYIYIDMMCLYSSSLVIPRQYCTCRTASAARPEITVGPVNRTTQRRSTKTYLSRNGHQESALARIAEVAHHVVDAVAARLGRALQRQHLSEHSRHLGALAARAVLVPRAVTKVCLRRWLTVRT